jgi:hypothetical protein
MNGGVGTLILSIDLELDLEDQDNQLPRRLDERRHELVALTRSYGIPVTWAVADPVLSAATESILAAGCGHEIAVLGHQAWLGQGCGRARLDRELARRFAGARKAGIAASTLALRGGDQLLDLDLLLDHGVTAIRGPAAANWFPARRNSLPPIRFGLWQPPAAWLVPPRQTWWAPATWRVRHVIQRTIRQGGLLHLEIDAARLVTAGQPALRLVDRIVAHVAAKRDTGLLRVMTIQQLAAAILAQRAGTPSRSILQSAAA